MYNNILTKYSSITLDEFKTAINELSEWIWKCTDDATVNLAIMDLIVNGDIYDSDVSRYSYIYQKFPNMNQNEFSTAIDILSDWVWKCTDNAIVNLAIMDLIVNGDIDGESGGGDEEEPTKALYTPRLTINSEYTVSLTANSADTVAVEEYRFYANGDEIYSSSTSFIRLPNLMESLGLPYAEYIITGKVFNSTENLESPFSNSVTYNFEAPDTLIPPTLSVAGTTALIRSDEYSINYILYANGIEIYRGTSQSVYLPSALDEAGIEYGVITLTASIISTISGEESALSNAVTYSYLESFYIPRPIIAGITSRADFVIFSYVTRESNIGITGYIWYANDEVIWTQDSTSTTSTINLRAAILLYNDNNDNAITSGNIEIKVQATNWETGTLSDKSEAYIFNYVVGEEYLALEPPQLRSYDDYQFYIDGSINNCGITPDYSTMKFYNVDDEDVYITSDYYSSNAAVASILANAKNVLTYERDNNRKYVPYGTYRVSYRVGNNFYNTQSPYSNEIEIVFSE